MADNITITRNEKLSAPEINELFRTNNWQVEPVTKLEKSLESMWGWVTARTLENRLVGFVEILSDGYQHAYILKMIVHPEYRKQGIGFAVMSELMQMIQDNDLLACLVANPGNAGFYEKFGFKTNVKGLTAMCVR